MWREYDFFKLGDSDKNGVDDAVGQDRMVAEGGRPQHYRRGRGFGPLAMGYSAALFDSDYWYLADGTAKGAKPLQYEFEVIREPGIPASEYGHVFAFDDSNTGSGSDKKADWDSSEVDANALRLYPGKYHHYQWAFTRAGTYEISVQLKGHVRTKDNAPAGAGAGWKPISDKVVETSEVRRYVFQIGPLTLNEDPAFEVERSVKENSATGTKVGDPIPVYQGDNDTMTFTLSGPGHSLFSVDADSKGNAQVKVAGDLDYEARSQYILTLGVSDKKDREGNANNLVDSSVALKINLEDVWEEPQLTLTVDTANPNLRYPARLTASKAGNIPADSKVTYYWVERAEGADEVTVVGGNSRTLTVTKETPGAWTYELKAKWTGSRYAEINSNAVKVTWR